MLLCIECPDNLQTGKDLSGNQVKAVYHFLYDLKFRHYNKEQYNYNCKNQSHCQTNDP